MSAACPMHGERETFAAPFVGYIREPGCACTMLPAPTGPTAASTDLDDTLANIRARAEAATPGPWTAEPAGSEGHHVFAPEGSRAPMRGRARVATCTWLDWYEAEADAEFIAHGRADVELLLNLVDDLRSRIGCVVEATYWDRPYDTRIAAIRGMCDLATDGMTPALDGADTTTTEPTECDHPGIEHGPFWATGICPKCRRCKFIGHGPLCVDCLTAATTTDGDAVPEGDTHA